MHNEFSPRCFCSPWAPARLSAGQLRAFPVSLPSLCPRGISPSPHSPQNPNPSPAVPHNSHLNPKRDSCDPPFTLNPHEGLPPAARG